MQGARKLVVAGIAVILVLSFVRVDFPKPEPAAPLPPPLPDTAGELLLLARDGNNLAREKLLAADRPAAMAAVKGQLCRPDYDHQPFYNQLLLDLEPGETRALVRDLLADTSPCFIPREAWVAAFTDAELKEMALTLPSARAHEAFELVREPDAAFVRTFLSNPANQWAHVIEYDVGVDAALRNYDVLTQQGRLILIDAMARRRTATEQDWRNLLARETNPCILQEVLFQQQLTDLLMASLDQHGGCPGNLFWRNWEWEKKAVAAYPDSFLARGVRAWEAVMGEGVYFSDGRFYTQRYRFPRYDSTAITYDPDREISAWLGFLDRFSRHPAADDAAYRLARSYEIKGDYVKAIHWLVRVADLPDGEFARQARGRITWILDALLTDEQLNNLDPAHLPATVRPQLDYARALRLLRAHRYDDAMTTLDALLARYGDQPSAGGTATDSPPPEAWAPLLRQQRAQVARLAELAPREDAEGRYALAALMFHDDYLFRNLLYRFGIGPSAIAGGGHASIAIAGDYEEQYGVWAGDQNNYVQAARAFARITDGPEEVLAKAAYSRALSLAMLPGPGSYIDLWRNEQAIGEEAAALFEAMANRFPTSDLADDALLSVAYLRQDPAYFDRIVQQYPDSDMAADARLRSLKGSSGIPAGAIPWRYLRPGDAPAEVEAWVRSHAGVPFAGTLEHGGWTYILVAREVQGPLFLGLGNTGNQVVVRQDYGLPRTKVAPAPALAHVLVRIKVQHRPIVFGS